jgi:hypothetical protein
MNDAFSRDVLRNVLSLMLRTNTDGEMRMTLNKRSETTCNCPINLRLPLRLSSMVAPEISNVLLRYRECKPAQKQRSEYQVLFYR